MSTSCFTTSLYMYIVNHSKCIAKEHAHACMYRYIIIVFYWSDVHVQCTCTMYLEKDRGNFVSDVFEKPHEGPEVVEQRDTVHLQVSHCCEEHQLPGGGQRGVDEQERGWRDTRWEEIEKVSRCSKKKERKIRNEKGSTQCILAS